jgi:hypothetical protein
MKKQAKREPARSAAKFTPVISRSVQNAKNNDVLPINPEKYQPSSPPLADFTKDLSPRFAGACVALKFRLCLIERLFFGGSRRAAGQQVGLMKFGQPRERL